MTGSPCTATEVAFLPDGKSVVRCEETSMWIKDLDDKSHEREIKLPEALYKDEKDQKDLPTPDIFCSPDGLLIVAGKNLAVSWNPVSQEWKELWRPPADRSITNVACDPKTGGILFDTTYTGADKDEDEVYPWFYWAKDAKEPAKVFNRRAPEPCAPFFDTKGDLYFICGGDLWKGYLMGSPQDTPYTLGGKRTWPIADLETESNNRNGALATQVIAFGNKLLVHLDYSHSIGATVRVPNVDAYKEGLPIKWEEVWGDNAYEPLTVSPDGKTAAMWCHGHWWVMDKPDGEFDRLSNDEEVDRHAKEAAEETAPKAEAGKKQKQKEKKKHR